MNARATWQLQWHNDGFANSDNQFTSGLAVRKHSPLASSLADTSKTPAFGKWLARAFLPDRADLHYRETWAIGQNLQTPDDLSLDRIVLNDVPYVGMMGWTNTFTAFDDDRLTGFGFLLGWVGEPALGKQSQDLAHDITGATKPAGWEHQLAFEPLFNAYWTHQRKLWDQTTGDGAAGVELGAGNFFTYAQLLIALRAGSIPDGFAFAPVPVGRGLAYDARLRRPGERHTYVSALIRLTAFGYALPFDGNLLRGDNPWTENNVISPERLTGQIIFGAHHERERWGLHLNFLVSTDTIEEGESLFPSENPHNNFGTLTLEWRP